MRRAEVAIVGSAFHSRARLARASKQPSIRSLPFLRFCPLCALDLIIVVSIPFVLPIRPACDRSTRNTCARLYRLFLQTLLFLLLCYSSSHLPCALRIVLLHSVLVQIRLRIPRVNPRLSSAYSCFESRRSRLIIFLTKRAIFSAVLCTYKRTPYQSHHYFG